MDSAHNGQFARWYVNNVFPRLKAGAPVIIHDIQQRLIRRIPGTESRFILKFLSERGVSPFSMSSLENKSPDWLNRRVVAALRQRLHLDQISLHESRGDLIMYLNRLLLRAMYMPYPYHMPDQRSKGNTAIFLRADSRLTQSHDC